MRSGKLFDCISPPYEEMKKQLEQQIMMLYSRDLIFIVN